MTNDISLKQRLSDEYEVLMALRKLANVRRMPRAHMLKPQTVAEHSFNVATMSFQVAKEMISHKSEAIDDTELKIALYTAVLALFHDAEEAIMSDIPYDVKAHIDGLDGLHERMLVNDHSRTMYRNVVSVEDIVPPVNLITEFHGMAAKIVKFCDMYDLFMTLSEERRLGNNTDDIVTVQHRAASICLDLYENMGPERDDSATLYMMVTWCHECISGARFCDE